MASWIGADERATRQKFAAARRHKVRTVTGGGPFEIAVHQGQLRVEEAAHLASDDLAPAPGFVAASTIRVLGGAVRTAARAVGLMPRTAVPTHRHRP